MIGVGADAFLGFSCGFSIQVLLGMPLRMVLRMVFQGFSKGLATFPGGVWSKTTPSPSPCGSESSCLFCRLKLDVH